MVLLMPPVWQKWGLPLWQKLQHLQPLLGSTDTLSPFLKLVTSEPTSTTVPENSWPKVKVLVLLQGNSPCNTPSVNNNYSNDPQTDLQQWYGGRCRRFPHKQLWWALVLGWRLWGWELGPAPSWRSSAWILGLPWCVNGSEIGPKLIVCLARRF